MYQKRGVGSLKPIFGSGLDETSYEKMGLEWHLRAVVTYRNINGCSSTSFEEETVNGLSILYIHTTQKNHTYVIRKHNLTTSLLFQNLTICIDFLNLQKYHLKMAHRGRNMYI
jgi:hypothetical protein